MKVIVINVRTWLHRIENPQWPSILKPADSIKMTRYRTKYAEAAICVLVLTSASNSLIGVYCCSVRAINNTWMSYEPFMPKTVFSVVGSKRAASFMHNLLEISLRYGTVNTSLWIELFKACKVSYMKHFCSFPKLFI